MTRVLFVCLGNICRSPTAEGILLDLVKRNRLEHSIFVDSAGTAAYHVGEGADARSQETANQHGVILPSRARQCTAKDIEDFDYIFAMDRNNLQNIMKLCKTKPHNVFLFRDFDPNSPANVDVPDPYYGGPKGFEEVFSICYSTCSAILERIHKELKAT